MCNIAGYIGQKDAAPIIIEMMRKEEGWNAGRFTGYATVCDGKLHTEKVVGSLDILLKKTGAASAPGNVGIIHSRTPGDKREDFQWSHPFLGQGDRHAYVYNGSMGMFKGWSDDFLKTLHQRFKSEGHTFRSELPANKPSAFGDVTLHSSELRSHYASKLIDDGMDAVDAMNKVCCDIPTEIVALMVTPEEPDCIFYSKTSYPMFLGIAPHGTYLATTPQVFPDDTESIRFLNNMTGGRVYCDRYTTKHFHFPHCKLVEITPEFWTRAYEVCVTKLQQQPSTYRELATEVRKVFEEENRGRLRADGAVTYSILYDLEKAGKIQKTVTMIPGQSEKTPAPLFYANWVD